MKFKKLISAFSAVFVSLGMISGLAVTADADTQQVTKTLTYAKDGTALSELY